MTSTHSFNFDNLSRLGDDVCGISARDTQNNKIGSYEFSKIEDASHLNFKPIYFVNCSFGI